MELECVFFSVTPTLISRSRITLLLTSSSLARSLIRTFCSIPPYFLRIVPSVYALMASSRCKFADPRLNRAPGCPKGTCRGVTHRELSHLNALHRATLRPAHSRLLHSAARGW